MTKPQVRRAGVRPPVRIDPTGVAGPTVGQARGTGWRKVAKGYYVPATVDSGALEQRIVEAATGLPDGAGVTGWAALAWVRTKWFNGLDRDGQSPLPVPIALDHRPRVRPRPGVWLTEDWLLEGDLVHSDGLPVTIPERSVSFEVRRARSLEDAVRVIDLAAAADRVSLASMTAYAARLPARPGIRRLRAAIPLADENVWSPLETTMRLVWMSARPTSLLCNVPLFDHRGNHLFTPDLLDPVAGVAGEYDGLVHLEDGVRRRDLSREDSYRDHGIELVTMLNSDLADRTGFEIRLARAYARSRVAGTQRSWTLETPPWWVETTTVEKRRALTDEQRRRWLRWQAA